MFSCQNLSSSMEAAMTIKAILSITFKFLSSLLGYYFASVIVLALTIPGADKYQIIFLAWIAGAIVAFYSHRNLLIDS